MIVIITAVDRENTLLLKQLTSSQHQHCGHLNVTSGLLGSTPVAISTSGIGKSNTAAATALLLNAFSPDHLVMIGCGGAFVQSGLTLGDVAIAREEIYADEGVSTPEGFVDMADLDLAYAQTAQQRYFNHFPVNDDLSQRSLHCLQQADTSGHACSCGPFITVSTCSGTQQLGAQRRDRYPAIIENMEGAAAAHICALNAVSFFELRGVSNFIEDRDPSHWNLALAMDNAQKALLTLIHQGLFTD